MQVSSWALTLGLGAAVGAIGVMMLPGKCTAKKMAHDAADGISSAVSHTTAKMRHEMDL